MFKLIYYFFVILIIGITILVLLSAFLGENNFKFLVVKSGSMEPSIKMGSLVMIKREKEYTLGDVITFSNPKKPQELITHRIVNIEKLNSQKFYTTKGDANGEPDPKKVAKREVRGKVLFSVPYLGYLVDFVKKPLGFVLVVIVPAVLIILDETRNIFREIKIKRI